MKKFTIFIVLSSILTCFTFLRTHSAAAYTVSRAEAVMEVGSMRVLSEKNSDEKLPMASTTKIATAITVIENCDIESVAEVPASCAGIEGSSVYLKAGDKFTVKDLLFGLMLRSGNDCAETLAVETAGSIEKFAALMNEIAKKCGAENTNFVNPHGLPDDDHYTSAEDLCKISCYAMRNPFFKELVSCKSYTATELNSGEKRVWINKNKLLSRYEGANGVKTGYTVKAGRCLVSSAERNGMQIVCVVLDSPQMFERSEELLDSAFANYSYVKVVDSEKFDYELFNADRTEKCGLTIDEDFYYPVGNSEKISAEINLPEYIENIPVEKKKIGDIKIYCQKQLIFSENIYTLK